MFARPNGAKMSEVRDITGDTHYNLINQLKKSGFDVVNKGGVITLKGKKSEVAATVEK